MDYFETLVAAWKLKRQELAAIERAYLHARAIATLHADAKNAEGRAAQVDLAVEEQWSALQTAQLEERAAYYTMQFYLHSGSGSEAA